MKPRPYIRDFSFILLSKIIQSKSNSFLEYDDSVSLSKFFVYDYALITLKQGFDIRHNNIVPICLPFNLLYEYDTNTWNEFRIIGFGEISAGQFPSLEAYFKKRNHVGCSSRFFAP